MKSIFLSHSSEDKEFVRELHKNLSKNGINSWIDEAEIKMGDSLIQKIGEGIEKADYVAIILSPKSIKSNWCQKELEIAITKEIKHGRTSVIPILIEDCKIPPFLEGKKYGDFRTSGKSLKGLMELLSILTSGSPKKEHEHERTIKKKINLKKLKEIIAYASGYTGLGLTNKEAATWALDSLKYAE